VYIVPGYSIAGGLCFVRRRSDWGGMILITFRWLFLLASSLNWCPRGERPLPRAASINRAAFALKYSFISNSAVSSPPLTSIATASFEANTPTEKKATVCRCFDPARRVTPARLPTCCRAYRVHVLTWPAARALRCAAVTVCRHYVYYMYRWAFIVTH